MTDPIRAPRVRLPRPEGAMPPIPDTNLHALHLVVRRQLDWETCCEFAGIDYDWLLWVAKQADQYPDGPAHEFIRDLDRSTADGKVLLVSALFDADDPRWKAWLLERKYPTEFGTRLQLSGSVDVKLAEMERRLKAISEAQSDETPDGDS